jgi:SAM-dependent methyltransferase
MQQMGLTDRVTCVAGDFTADPLPGGCDLAWLSAIMHMNSPEENRRLYAVIHDALEPGGVLLIRDVVMEHCRTQPSGGAMFAVNMLVGTEGGGTFTYDEMHADLEATGYAGIELVRQDPYMNSIVAATKP